MSGAPACSWCGGVVPAGARRDAVWCSKRCRQAAWRFRRDAAAGAVAGIPSRPMVFAYADPPYPGMAGLYRDHPDYAGEVDHRELVSRLVSGWPDGWALSTSSRSLGDVLRLCPSDVRVGAWTHGAPPGYTRRPRSAWEPVIFAGGRQLPKDGLTVLDWTHAAQLRSYPGQVVGTKPPAFCRWVFACLGARAGDTLDDLYRGSGAVMRAWQTYTSGDASGGAFAEPPPPPALEWRFS